MEKQKKFDELIKQALEYLYRQQLSESVKRGLENARKRKLAQQN